MSPKKWEGLFSVALCLTREEKYDFFATQYDEDLMKG